ncbi:interleukin-1 receptor type 1 [Cebidichthys violaceus]|uniref:interleukin-1 receptor type 1 n=1 Tax=Cebidichthys violaceus TaxID=271503 RepID=UPI0035C99A9A
MGQQSTTVVFLLGLFGICAGFEQENCTDYKLQFERVFSVPGDTAMLNSTLVSPDVFDFTAVPYNVTWYDSKTGREMSEQSGRILVKGETLWFLKLQLDDSGEYVSILRTPSRCYRLATELVVEPPVPGECGRPRKALQTLTNTVTDMLNCPLKDYIGTLDGYNVTSRITWYRGCEPIVDGVGRYTYMDSAKLKIDGVERNNNSSYTCTLTFTLGGVTGSVSETIEAWVSDKYSLTPEVHEPANEVIKAPMGSNFSKWCRVFVPCVGRPDVYIAWKVDEYSFILNTKPDRIYTSKPRSWRENSPTEGVWMERALMFSELTTEDFERNYTCVAQSSRGSITGYFTLLPADPNIILPIGLVLGGVTVLFVVSVILYYVFKVDIVLWFRRTFPVLYKNTDLDGKSYDAYVAYPQPCAVGFSKEVEAFALHTLPQVLEKACGYKLFVPGRDCVPGKAIVDSVEENMQASRRLLLLYTASTFLSKRHTSSTSNNNNNVCKSDDDDGKSGTSFDGSGEEEEVCSDTRQQLECVTAMHRALLEGSLKVILVELEQISPAQLALFPESVRHLRKKQGAVCRWKNLKSSRTRGDEETGGQDLSTSSRFWKEIRYRMPVRGKRAAEKTALLNF